MIYRAAHHLPCCVCNTFLLIVYSCVCVHARMHTYESTSQSLFGAIYSQLPFFLFDLPLQAVGLVGKVQLEASGSLLS